MFRFVFLGVCIFVWINQSIGGVEPLIELNAGPVTRVFSPPTTTVGETTPTSTRATDPTTTGPPTPPSSTPYLDKTYLELISFILSKLTSMNDAIAKEQDALDARVVKVLTSFETQRRALVKGIRNFGFSTVLSTDTRFAIADGVTGIINCMKSAELELEYLPIGITGDFSFPEDANTFDNFVLGPLGPSLGSIYGAIFSAGETCARKMDLTVAKWNAKFSSTFVILNKCASNFTSVNVDDIKSFETSAALALKQVDPVVKAVTSCKWTLAKGIDTCAKTIIRAADASSICDDTSALSPMLGNMLTAAYGAVTNCIGNAVLSGVGQSAALSLQSDIISKCGSSPLAFYKSVEKVTPTKSIIKNQSSNGILNFYVKKDNMKGIYLN